VMSRPHRNRRLAQVSQIGVAMPIGMCQPGLESRPHRDHTWGSFRNACDAGDRVFKPSWLACWVTSIPRREAPSDPMSGLESYSPTLRPPGPHPRGTRCAKRSVRGSSIGCGDGAASVRNGLVRGHTLTVPVASNTKPKTSSSGLIGGKVHVARSFCPVLTSVMCSVPSPPVSVIRPQNSPSQ
jgi:hypothetical protein